MEKVKKMKKTYTIGTKSEWKEDITHQNFDGNMFGVHDMKLQYFCTVEIFGKCLDPPFYTKKAGIDYAKEKVELDGKQVDFKEYDPVKELADIVSKEIPYEAGDTIEAYEAYGKIHSNEDPTRYFTPHVVKTSGVVTKALEYFESLMKGEKPKKLTKADY